jgi:hypothetical protein
MFFSMNGTSQLTLEGEECRIAADIGCDQGSSKGILGLRSKRNSLPKFCALRFLAGRIAPKAQNCEKHCARHETAWCINAKGKHAGQIQPRASSRRLEAFINSITDCAKRNKRGLMATATMMMILLQMVL